MFFKKIITLISRSFQIHLQHMQSRTTFRGFKMSLSLLLCLTKKCSILFGFWKEDCVSWWPLVWSACTKSVGISQVCLTRYRMLTQSEWGDWRQVRKLRQLGESKRSEKKTTASSSSMSVQTSANQRQWYTWFSWKHAQVMSHTLCSCNLQYNRDDRFESIYKTAEIDKCLIQHTLPNTIRSLIVASASFLKRIISSNKQKKKSQGYKFLKVAEYRVMEILSG